MLNARSSLYYRVLDGLLTLLALQLSSFIRTTILIGKPILPYTAGVLPLLFLFSLIIWQTVLGVFGVYSVLPRPFRAPSLRRLIQAHIIATMTFWGVLYIIDRDFSRLQTLYFVVILLFLLVIYRLLWSGRHPLVGFPPDRKRNVLILGYNDYASEVGRIITDYGSDGLKLVGFVPHFDEIPPSDAEHILGSFDTLAQIMSTHEIDEIIVCDSSRSRTYLLQLNEILTQLPVNVRLAPDYSELAYFHVSVEDFGGVPLISLRYDMLTIGQRLTKRIFDMIGALLLLIAASILMIFIAIAIRMDSAGPVFFRQLRVGERGKLFIMYKFRTMVWDAESQITYTQNYKQADDPRVTRIGYWLRRMSLDEIPQFFNVLKGEMSLVGPRPELPHIVQFYSPWQRKRFEVPQGVTGWWQINGRADLPMYEHVEYDVFYIRNYSIWLDLQILLRTPLAILKGRGAY